MIRGQATVFLTTTGAGQRRVDVLPAAGPRAHEPTWCDTAYHPHLVRSILRHKGPDFLCDELRREEDPAYVERNLRWGMLAYVDPAKLAGKRILDFGCGCGASTLVLARLFPQSQIVGVEVHPHSLLLARRRWRHYRYPGVSFRLSPGGTRLPPHLGRFDAVVMSAVYEHLLPSERKCLLPRLWGRLVPGGILFLDQTPHRWAVLESHTTGLPLVAWLPDRVAHWAACRFSPRVEPGATWPSLLRRGIRGGTVREVLRLLARGHDGHPPTLLQPSRLGLSDRVDLWFAIACPAGASHSRRLLRLGCKALQGLGFAFTPYLALAIRKGY